MAENTSNALRFIKCYNLIDTALRNQGDMRRSISYTEAVRRAARTNGLVKKYEDKLIDYGRLRNAIVHSSNDEFVIAEPHLDVVEDYEKITKMICTPPLAISTICNKDFLSVEGSTKCSEVLELCYKKGFSNVPIYKNDMLIGVANLSKIGKILGKLVFEKKNVDDFINNTAIENVVKLSIEDNYYAIANDKITLDRVLTIFSENRKLLLIVLTRNGTLLEKPIGIISVGDIMDISRILDDYNE